jgi:hypothetical protein
MKNQDPDPHEIQIRIRIYMKKLGSGSASLRENLTNETFVLFLIYVI